MTEANPPGRPSRPRAESSTDAAIASPPAPRTAPPARLALYYALLITQTVSMIGTQVSEYAVGIAIFRSTGHATPLALIAFFWTVPTVLLGGLSGALADRADRRTLMLIGNLGFTVVSGLLLLSFASGAFQLWHLYALTLATAAFAMLERPAFQASVAMLVPDSHRDRANAIGQMTVPAAGVIAPAAAGLLYAWVGVVGAIAIDIATFIVAIAVLAFVRIPMPAKSAEAREKEPGIWRQVFDDFRLLASRPVLLGVCGYISVVNLIANVPIVLLTAYVLARTGSAHLLGLVLAAMNVGGLAASLIISAGGRLGSRMNTTMLGIIGAGTFLGVAGVAQGPLALGASLFLMMFTLAFSNAPFWSIMQAKIPPDEQGRVFSAYLQVVILLSPVAFLMAGPLADQVFEPARSRPVWRGVEWLVGAGPGAGMGLMYAVSGVLILALSLAVYAIPAVRSLETDLPDYVATPA